MPRTEVFLEGQRSVIVKQVTGAKSFILVAMAYFTDSSLFDLLVKKAREGVRVQLIVRDDEVNTMSGIDYAALKSINGDFCYNKTIHNKFCVIDGTTILSGSYNWTNQARNNHEDLTLIDGDLRAAALFMIKFFKIKDPAHFIDRALLQDSDAGNRSRQSRADRQQALREKINEQLKQTAPKQGDNPPPASS